MGSFKKFPALTYEQAQEFEQLYTSHYSKVLNLMNHLTKNRLKAEELTQETFFRACRSYPRFKREAQFSTWVITIARNTYFEGIRKSTPLEKLGESDSEGGPKKIKSVFLSLNDPNGDGKAMDIPASNQGPDQILIKSELSAHVTEAMNKLSKERQEILRLRHYESLSCKEIAKKMKSTVPAVKAEAYRGRQAMRNLLREVHI